MQVLGLVVQVLVPVVQVLVLVEQALVLVAGLSAYHLHRYLQVVGLAE